MFSELVVGYLFLGGAGSGALVTLSVLEGANAQRRFGRSDEHSRLGRTFAGRSMGSLRVESSPHAEGSHYRYYESGYTKAAAQRASFRHGRRGAFGRALALPGVFFSYAWPVCLIVLALSILCLLADVGRPERIISLILEPHLSVMTIGAYALALSLVVSAVFSILSNFDGFEITSSLVYVLSAVGIVIGLTCAAYTGVLLSSLASVAFWQTWLLPAVFTASALSCGVALVMLAAAFVHSRQVFVRPLRWLARADSVLIIVEAVALVALIATGFASESAYDSANALIAGDLRWIFWGGVVIIGLLVPYTMERFVAHGNYSTQLLWVAAFVLIGGLLLRICIVEAAAYDVTQISELMYGMTLGSPASASSI